MGNILLVARQRPVVIQSLFPAINGEPPPAREIKQYAQRLKELKEAGAEISLVQIYSATRPMARTGCSHLPLKSLSQIAQTVRRVAGLRKRKSFEPPSGFVLGGYGIAVPVPRRREAYEGFWLWSGRGAALFRLMAAG
jgi:hypothetical protein